MNGVRFRLGVGSVERRSIGNVGGGRRIPRGPYNSITIDAIMMVGLGGGGVASGYWLTRLEGIIEMLIPWSLAVSV